MPSGMNAPAWYAGWRHEAVHQLQTKNARLDADFRLGEWPRWDYDLDAGTLVFSERGITRVVAEIQIAGSTSKNAGNWLWAWANESLPAALVTDSQTARGFGVEHGIGELTQECVTNGDLNALGWELSAVAVRICNTLGAYSPRRDEGGGLYMIYKSLNWAT